MDNNQELFWESSIEDLKKGYIFNTSKNEYICVMCGKVYKKGLIYGVNNELVDAEFAMKKHIEEKHKSTFDYLLNLDKKFNGLSDIQKIVMEGMYNNSPDSEIALKLDNKAKSTIRNHRFSLREKYKEAKIYISLMDLIKEKEVYTEETNFIHFHKSIPVNDDRIVITENEKNILLKKYFNEDYTTLKKFPLKQKEKLVILQQIIKSFDKNKKYTEKEVNQIIQNIYPDHVTIRRYLIDYAFMDRKPDGSLYWLKE